MTTEKSWAGKGRWTLCLQGRNTSARWLIALVSSVCCSTGSAQTTDEELAARIVERETESVFATSVVLTDTEVMTFGLLSFDPGTFISLGGDEFGTEESIGRRDSVATFALPWKWTLASDDSRLRPYLQARLSFLRTEQDLGRDAINENETLGASKDRVYGGFIGGGLLYDLTDNWEMDAGTGLHLLRYQNAYDGETREDVAGFLSDSAATALMGGARARLTYRSETSGVPWRFRSTYNYYAGRTVASGQELRNVRPETWSWANGITAYRGLPDVLDTTNTLRVLARRVDVGGDVTRALETHHYYQLGVGWLFDIDGNPSWLENLGISVMLNYGSALSGGSLLLLYNEDW